MTRVPYTPKEQNRIMFDHMLNVERCAVWSFMGSGKTSSALTALDALFIAGEDRPALVLAPLRVARSTWPDEAAKWQHLRHINVAPIVGTVKERLAALKKDVSVKTINYDNLVWLVEHYGDRWPFRTVISDESTRLKSFRLRQGGKRARALGRVAHKHVKRFIELSGTPSPNGLKDLWGQAWFLDAGARLGRTMEAFKSRWFRPTYDGYDIEPLPFAQEQIQDKLRDLCLSLRAEDYFDVSKPIPIPVYVELPAKARRLYRDMEKEMFARIEGHDVEAFNAAALTMKCLQLANGAAYVDDKGTFKEVHDAKLEALDSIIEEANGAPVLVAYHFKSDLARIQRAFPYGRALDSDPSTIRDWNEGRIRILFAHPASAGHGLNLQDGGNIIAFFGHWWNLEEYQQIIERIGPVRQAQAGHPRPVYVYHIVARDTVDEMVMARRESKREVQDILMEAMRVRR